MKNMCLIMALIISLNFAYGNGSASEKNQLKSLKHRDRQYQQIRRQTVESEIKAAETYLKTLKFGSPDWWKFKEEIYALEREKNALNRYSNYFNLSDRKRFQEDYFRVHQQVLEAQSRCSISLMNYTKFGSPEWWAFKEQRDAFDRERNRLSALRWQEKNFRDWQAQRRCTLEKQIKAQELKLKTLKFGSRDWWTIKDTLYYLEMERKFTN